MQILTLAGAQSVGQCVSRSSDDEFDEHKNMTNAERHTKLFYDMFVPHCPQTQDLGDLLPHCEAYANVEHDSKSKSVRESVHTLYRLSRFTSSYLQLIRYF
jgi:hypothetical protein